MMKCFFHAPCTSRRLRLAVVFCGMFYVVTFCVALPYFCSDLAYSLYFDTDPRRILPHERQAMQENGVRRDVARSYVQTLPRFNVTNDPPPLLQSVYDVTVGIVTRRREQAGFEHLQLGYLTQTFASLHRAASASDCPLVVKLFLCNVDSEPRNFREIRNLTGSVEIFTKYASKTIKYNGNLFEKQKRDYVDCLKYSQQNWRSSYVILFEDDVIARSSFFHELFVLLQTKLVWQLERRNLERQDLAFVKLAYPSQWRGFSVSSNLLELAGVALLSCSFFYLLLTYCCQVQLSQRSSRESSSRSVIYFATVASTLYVVCLCFVIGRPYIVQIFTHSPHLMKLEFGAPGCCLLAMVYPSNVLPRLIDYLDSITCHIDFAVDSAMDDFGRIFDLFSFRVDPNLGTHIGLVSGLGRHSKTAARFIDKNLL